MAVRIVNKMGVISIENEIIEAAAAITVLDCYGIAGLASKRDKKNGSVILYGDDYSQAIGLKISEKTLSTLLQSTEPTYSLWETTPSKRSRRR